MESLLAGCVCCEPSCVYPHLRLNVCLSVFAVLLRLSFLYIFTEYLLCARHWEVTDDLDVCEGWVFLDGFIFVTGSLTVAC